MNLAIDLTCGPTNTAYAPLAVLSALYRQFHWLEPLQNVQMTMRDRYFRPADKLIQVLLGILTGGEILSAANVPLKQELGVAQVWGWRRCADQSSLSRTLDALSLKNIDQLRTSQNTIHLAHSRLPSRDWRPFLWLDFDLTPLPCGPMAQASMKGYFGEKKSPGTAVGPGECNPRARNDLVRGLSRQHQHGPVLCPSGTGNRNCFRLIRTTTQAYRVAHGWRGGNRRALALAAVAGVSGVGQRL